MNTSIQSSGHRASRCSKRAKLADICLEGVIAVFGCLQDDPETISIEIDRPLNIRDLDQDLVDFLRGISFSHGSTRRLRRVYKSEHFP